MNDEVKKIIGESYKRLPFDLKKAIVSSETRQQVQVIADRHHLFYEQEADLEMETALVMLGLRPPADFITNVRSALNIPEEKARAIAEDINVEIFRPVRESLKKIHNISEPPTPPKQEIAAPASSASLAFQKKELPSPATDKTEIAPKPDLMSPQLGVGETESSDENEDNLSREEILAGIENPVPAKSTNNIAQDKLEGLIKMPKSEQEIKAPAIDPYREPIG